MTKQSAADSFECDVKRIKTFEEVDNFNPENTLGGFMSRADNHHYGSFFLTHINNKRLPSPQRIYGSPKQHYPYDRNGIWRFPKNICYINIYEKYDGTNIVAYRYYNPFIRKYYTTYKTRLCAVAREGIYGNFYAKWKKVMDKHPEIRDLVNHYSSLNLSFELYGKENHHLILYSNVLDYALLFGIDRSTGRIVDIVDTFTSTHHPDIHCALKYRSIEKKTDLISYYKSIQAEIESGNTTIVENEAIKGMEGTVWYAHIDTIGDNVVQLKCIATTVEGLHHAHCRGMSNRSIITTVFNSLENSDDLSYPFIRTLLLEEFDSRMIDANEDRVLAVIQFVKRKVEFRYKVLEEYRNIGISVLEDKAIVMRAMSQMFAKNRIREIYGILIAEEG